MAQVLKVVERVLVDGSEQQKWAVTHFLMTSLQSSIKAAGLSTDATAAAPRTGHRDLVERSAHRIRPPPRTGS